MVFGILSAGIIGGLMSIGRGEVTSELPRCMLKVLSIYDRTDGKKLHTIIFTDDKLSFYLTEGSPIESTAPKNLRTEFEIRKVLAKLSTSNSTLYINDKKYCLVPTNVDTMYYIESDNIKDDFNAANINEYLAQDKKSVYELCVYKLSDEDYELTLSKAEKIVQQEVIQQEVLPEEVLPEVVQPEAVQLEVVQPEVVQSEVVQPEAPQQEAPLSIMQYAT